MSTAVMKNRRIDPGVCASEIVGGLGPWAQILFERMPMAADRDGLLEDRPRRIRALIFPYNDGDTNITLNVDELLDELEKAGFIMRYEKDNIKAICIVNFNRHQPVHPGEKASILPRPPSWPVPKGGKGKDNPDPTYPIKCDFIIDEIKNILNLPCSYAKAGKILEMAGDSSEFYRYAWSIIAIRRAKKWIKTDQFLGAIRKELQQRGRWTDKDNENAKIEAETMLKFLEKHFREIDGSEAE